MSTRSMFIVTGRDMHKHPTTVRLYMRSDGYPTNALSLIFEAIEQAEALQTESNTKWANTDLVNPVCLSGALVAQSLSIYGLGINVEKTMDGPFDSRILGNQADLEWIYIIDIDEKTVKVYGGGYTGKLPKTVIKKGMVDPCTYVKQLYAEYQESELQEIRQAIKAIEGIGYTVN